MNSVALNSPQRQTNFAYWHEAGLALLLFTFMLVAGVLEPRFVQPAQQLSLAGDVWPMALVALPMALIVITGGIDLSVGGTTALCAVTFAIVLEEGGDPWLAILLTLFVGSLCGLANAMLIARLSLHPLIVTLATMACFRGIALAVTKGRTIQSVPARLGDQIQGLYTGLPLPMIACLVAFAAVAMLLTRSPYGRFLYAIGHNEVAARYSGIPTEKIKLALYTASGLASGGAAVLLATRYGQAKADFANGLELEVLTAVVLGGISIFGGRGNLVGLVIGLVLLHQCRKFVPWHWHVSELSALVTGSLLIGSVLLNTFISRRRIR